MGTEVGSNDMREQAIERVRALFTEIARAKYLAGEAFGDPWDTEDPGVIRAWNKLIAPENITDLTLWAADIEKFNPVARVTTERALARCRERVEEEWGHGDA